MIQTKGFILLTACAVLCCVFSHPERPALPDSPEARELFRLAEQNRTSDGFLTKAEVYDVFTDFDINMDGSIDETEFLTVWKAKDLGTPESGMTLFHHADTDRDDVLSITPDMDRVFYYFDRNQDAKVSQAEFVTVWVEMSL
ncbi:insoluble matrix shell protein 5-like [Pecten maximus]|uniref:insoluble matrix shell protein 5-like n=1 Tax=Pecten maximus TaxID=6579 RepID=UPI0014586629|nr:insoluble matrix shell protein 5-like [Pecten maximus]